ncbi:LytTR family transcriptional regulator DNA-binding domain-containing protein [Hyphobacterium sp. HN65]|uniref:LytTR family transcriptional regulator DNA-binding domain-containing protein n=1 Tax=Hyphobacterium lacteum TaxID=3116575 RepID=A0ABU7LTV6_9PROT|nr:LytTR family transcriptional regulator DNA-binding domain-containing protein [Hyphobacterium sp. HN65]MEE2527358.1 LytTR family transcriptional regulator DNA-binding domain-containing protein [Hyphobacterium sp. HN65]
MRPPDTPPTILLSAPEALQRRLQSVVAGRARIILMPGPEDLGHFEKLPGLSAIEGVILAEESVGMDGRRFARFLEQENVPYLLATASGHQAHLVFELNARGYVLLTHPEDQIADTVGKFLASLTHSSDPSIPGNAAVANGDDVIWVRTGHAERRICCEDIVSISADKDYAIIELGNASILVRTTMTALEEELDASRFIRIHRSHIVATDSIEELRTLGPNRHEVSLENGRRFPVGRTYWPKLKHQLRSARVESQARAG